MSDLVGKPEDRFSHSEAQLAYNASFKRLGPQEKMVYLSRVARKSVFGISKQADANRAVQPQTIVSG